MICCNVGREEEGAEGLTGVVQEMVDTVELGLENTMLEQEDLANMSPDWATTSAASNRAWRLVAGWDGTDTGGTLVSDTGD